MVKVQIPAEFPHPWVYMVHIKNGVEIVIIRLISPCIFFFFFFSHLRSAFFAVYLSLDCLFLVLLLHQDKSTPEDQSSWDSFKTMTPELSIVPGEQKDRMELHNKNWDSSSANTPDSSEGDFQTEVWRRRRHSLKYKHAHVETQRHTEILNLCKVIHKWFSAKISHTLLPVSCALLDPILYLFTAEEDRHEKKTVLLYIFHKDYWKRTGAWHVWDWQHFLNELKNTMRNLFLRKNVLILFWRKKKKISFKCLMIWGGKE